MKAWERRLERYLDTLRIFNTYNNLSPRPGLPKYLEIRASGIFNGTENGTETQRRFANFTCELHSDLLICSPLASKWPMASHRFELFTQPVVNGAREQRAIDHRFCGSTWLIEI